MKKFSKNILLLLILLGTVVFLANQYMFFKRKEDLKENTWAAIIDKHTRLDSLPSPKIVLVGGSNIMFGLSAKMLEDTFNIPAQNLGLGGALGLKFMLNETLPSVKKGDIIIVSTEYFLDKGDNNVLLFMSEIFPPAKNYLTFDSKIDEIRAKLLYKIFSIRNAFLLGDIKLDVNIDDTENVYFRSAFNKQGDIMSHINNVQPAFLKDKMIFEKSKNYELGIEVLNDFAKKVQLKGAKIFFTFPAQPQSVYEANKEVFDNLAEKMAQKGKFKTLDTPQKMALPDSLFFDTVNHPKAKGRAIRTVRLIESLKQNLSK
jgi:hypothetical protein